MEPIPYPSPALYDKVFKFFLRKLYGNETIAKDLTQKTFEKVQSKINSIKEKKKLPAFTWSVAKHLFIDYLKKLNRPAIEPMCTQSCEPDSRILEQECDVQLHAAISYCLSEKEKEVINLRYFNKEGHILSYEEVARRLEKSIGTVSALFSHAYKKLRNALEKDRY